jgi:hypothetical protein
MATTLTGGLGNSRVHDRGGSRDQLAPGAGEVPPATLRFTSGNGPQFIVRDFKEFIRICVMTHMRDSPFYPQSNGKIDRQHPSASSTVEIRVTPSPRSSLNCAPCWTDCALPALGPWPFFRSILVRLEIPCSVVGVAGDPLFEPGQIG